MIKDTSRNIIEAIDNAWTWLRKDIWCTFHILENCESSDDQLQHIIHIINKNATNETNETNEMKLSYFTLKN